MEPLLLVFGLPGVLGLFFRVGVGKSGKGHLVPVVCVIAAFLMWVIARTAGGSAEAYGIYALSAIAFAAGTVLGEVCVVLWMLVRRGSAAE